MFKFSLVPNDNRFFILFQQGAGNVVKMAREFKELVYVWENVKERVSILSDLERDGDAITHQVMALLYRTFITPLDREDISLLAQSLDDIADRIHLAADMMFLYRIEHPTDKAKELADIILQVATEVERAISGISGHIDRNQLLKQYVEINRLENLGKSIYHTALADLFCDNNDISYVIKWREIYQLMESPIDMCEVAANVIEGVAIKYG